MPVTPRRYYAFFKFDGDAAALWEERLTDALNYLGKEGKRSVAAISANDFGLLMEVGVEAVETFRADNFEETQVTSIARKLKTIHTEKALHDGLAEIYEREGLDAFVEWCEAEGITGWTQALEAYNEGLFEKKAKRPWSEKAGDWLAELLGDGKPHHISEIKREALRAGVLSDDDEDTIGRDWQKLKVIASRRGNSAKGSRGWWEE